MAVPERVLTNNELAQLVDTTDEWIVSRTGIRERRIAAEDQTTASLAADAALKALSVAKLKPADLDLIIVSTSSPEHIFPATACLVQDRIGASKAGAFDLLAACSGFIYALNMGSQAIRSGSVSNVLVIGAETLSRMVDWKDRNTCILFGDGAGAFVLQAAEEPRRGHFGSDALGWLWRGLADSSRRRQPPPYHPGYRPARTAIRADERARSLPLCHPGDEPGHPGGREQGGADPG